MDVLSLLNSIRDPAIFLAVALLVIYLNRNYLTKESAHVYRSALEERLKEFEKSSSELEKSHLLVNAETRLCKIENDIQNIRSEYVSKEKLSDVLKPIHDSLSSIKEMLEKYVQGGNNRRGD